MCVLSPPGSWSRSFSWLNVRIAGSGNHWMGVHLLADAQNNRVQVHTEDLSLHKQPYYMGKYIWTHEYVHDTSLLHLHIQNDSIKPKRRMIQNQYTDSESMLQSKTTTTNTHFQSPANYSLYEPGYENASKKEGVDEEGIYEVLDGEEEKSRAKRQTGRERRVILSGGESESYNKLKFEDLQ